MRKIARKLNYNTQYILEPKHQTSRWIMGVFLAVLIFIFVFFPFFGLNWRYEIGGVFSIMIDALGGFCLTVGGLFLLVGFVGIFTRSPRWIRNVIVGVTLLWIGCWCTGAVLNLMGIPIGDATSSGGSGWHFY
ncbi:MAG: hypothetical protein ACFFAA_03790 [Promethearchaeota archaeon]